MPRWWLAVRFLVVEAFVPADVLHGPHVRPREGAVNLPALAPRRPSLIPARARTADDDGGGGFAAGRSYFDQMTAPIPHMVKTLADAMPTPPLGELRQALDVLANWPDVEVRPSLLPADARTADSDDDDLAAGKVYFDQMAGPFPEMVKRLADAMPTPEPGPFRGVRAVDVLSRWSSMQVSPAVDSETRKNIGAAQRALSAGEASHVYALAAKVEPGRTAASHREDYAIRHVFAIGVARYACVGGSLCGLDITHVVAKPSGDRQERANYEGELLHMISSWTARGNSAVMIGPPSEHAARGQGERDGGGLYERWGFFPMGGKFEGVYLGVAEPYRETEHSLVELVAGAPVTV